MTREFYVIKNGNGLLVENWGYCYGPKVIYCKSPEWAMKFDKKEDAQERIQYFNQKKFKNVFNMTVVKIQENHFYKEIK